MIKKILFFTVLFFLAVVCFSQTAIISGYITFKDSTNSNKAKPIDGANITILDSNTGTSTDKDGFYKLVVPANKDIIIEISHATYLGGTFTLNLKEGENFEYNTSLVEKTQEIETVVVFGTVKREEGIIELDPKKSDKIALTSITGMEASLKVEAGVYAKSEFSSQYNVRGGNFDENAVFVNNIPIYKPLLINSGKQEGLSFINPHLVESISFSAGGYEAMYGDKMSSVLDITYKKPTKRTIVADASFMGANLTYGGVSKDKKFTHISGFRYKNTSLLLNGLRARDIEIFNSLQDSGTYIPSFKDFQSYITYQATEKTSIEAIAYASGNKYEFYPVVKYSILASQDEIFELPIYFEGGELDNFNTYVGSLSLIHQHSDSARYSATYSFSVNEEHERYDILGEYWLNDLKQLDEKAGETDSLYQSSIGRYLQHARNDLLGQYHNISFSGKLVKRRNIINYGIGGRYEIFSYSIHKWMYVDSAQYNIPYAENTITIKDFHKREINHSYAQFFAYVQNRYKMKLGNGILNINSGLRVNYRPINNEFLVSPRLKFSYRPNTNRFLVFNLSTGLYNQTPFFKEMVTSDFQLYKNIKSQKSIHVVAGSDIDLTLWGRPFKFVSALYYKHLLDIIPYNINNVRIEYLPELDAHGYATGIDLKLNGEFIEDTESWISFSLMQTREDVVGDTLKNGKEAGWIRRPSDQRVNIGLFFQDYLPMDDSYKVNLTFMFGTNLPTGPPSNQRVYKDINIIPDYKRVDMGVAKIFIDDENRKGIKYLSVGAEIFNLLNIPNVISYLWIQDIEGRYRALPNNLSFRSINLKVSAKI